MRPPVPFDIPGQRNKTSFGVAGGALGRRVVTLEIIFDLVGPNDQAGPHVSATANERNIDRITRKRTENIASTLRVFLRETYLLDLRDKKS
jgi:hypothetical protein